MKKIIYVDFDGVINSFKTPFSPDDPFYLPDPPVDGAIEWLQELVNSHYVTIYTCRMLQGKSQACIVEWLLKHNLPMSTIEQLSFSCVKGTADVYIDDKAYRFEGVFPSMQELNNLKPWNQQDVVNKERQKHLDFVDKLRGVINKAVHDQETSFQSDVGA